jgi:hypothetical protein
LTDVKSKILPALSEQLNASVKIFSGKKLMMENLNIETKPKEEKPKTPGEDLWGDLINDPDFRKSAEGAEEAIAAKWEVERTLAKLEEDRKEKKESEESKEAAA